MGIPNQGSEFRIEEVSGPESQRNTIVLSGRALPYRPYTLRGTQRGDVTWYQGDPVGEAQVLGPSEEPTTINGVWKDTFIQGSTYATLNGDPLADARAIVVAVDNIRRQGKMVLVTWDEEVRKGWLSMFERSWDRRTDVAWSIEFTWISQGDVELPPQISPTVDISDLSFQLGGTLEAIYSDFETLTFNATPQALTNATTQLEKLKAKQKEFQDVVTAAISNAMAPIESARRSAAVLTSMADDALVFIQALEANVLFSLRATSLFTAGAVFQVVATVRGTINRLNELRSQALSSRELLLTGVDNSTLEELIGVDGDDLRRVAQSRLSNANDWRVLAIYNNVRSSAITRGQRIKIPKQFGGR